MVGAQKFWGEIHPSQVCRELTLCIKLLWAGVSTLVVVQKLWEELQQDVRTHPNAQCFLLHISHRNTDYWAPLNAPPPSPQRGETCPHKPVNGKQERGGIRHAWQIFITFFKASLDEVHMGCASMSSMEHIQKQRIHLLKGNMWLTFLSFKLVEMKEQTILLKEWFSLSTFTLMKIFFYIRFFTLQWQWHF